MRVSERLAIAALVFVLFATLWMVAHKIMTPPKPIRVSWSYEGCYPNNPRAMTGRRQEGDWTCVV